MADQIVGPRSSRPALSPGSVAGAPAVGVGTRITGAAVAGVRAASFPVRLGACTGATLPPGGRCQVFLRLDTSLADATARLTEVSGVVRNVPLHGLVIDGYTRDGDAEPGSRCKFDTVLATVTRELELHVATGPTAWEGGVTALDLGVRRPPASSCSADPREREGLCRPIMPALIARDAATTGGRGWRRVLLSTSVCLLSRGRTRPFSSEEQ